jgi:hypothetical protein
VCGFLGSALHPSGDPTLTGDAGLASWVGDPMWVTSHALILAATVLLVPALLGLTRTLTGNAHTAARVATAVSIVWVVESVPHLLAALDEDALLSGRAAPFLMGHIVGSAIVYPLVGLAFAALALLGGGALAHPVFNVLGAVGALAFGFAPIAVGPLGIDALGVLFSGSLLLTAWLVVVGVTALMRGRAAG